MNQKRETEAHAGPGGRLILVSNRLPVQWDAVSGEFRPASGGLVQALSGVKAERPRLWMGAVSAGDESRPFGEGLHPVELAAELYESYYSGMANDVLWPLFHYEQEYVRFEWRHWDSYCAVNRRFAEELARILAPGDVIWIHDYHLFMLPRFLRELSVEQKVGFFLHIPFPSSEIYRTLPVREQILSSLIDCDLVGFHDYSYLRHFVQSLNQSLGLESDMLKVERLTRRTEFGVFPVSIDTDRFAKSASQPAVQRRIRQLAQYGDYQELILGVDRLDYIKGIDLKLRIFEAALERDESLMGRVALLQIAVPSRTEVQEYAKTKSEVEQLVGRINGRFGTPTYTPVKYIFSSVDFAELLALYRHARVLFVASKRDGMNLVALEYIAAQDPRNPGAVLLSEFAGAASNLSHVTLINPWNVTESAERLSAVLALSIEERRARHAPLLRYLKDYDATSWAESFVARLSERPPPAKEAIVVQPREGALEWWPAQLERLAQGRVKVLLDYDGTLVPIRERPDQAVLGAGERSRLAGWLATPDVEFILVSGRPAEFLQEQARDLPVSLAADHGARFFDHRRGSWLTLARTRRREWYASAARVMQDYAHRVPGSFIEKKDFSIAWHYRNAPTNFAEYQSRRLVEDLEWSMIRFPVSIIRGKKVIEVRMIESNKGYFANWYRTTHPEGRLRDYVMVGIGDDRTDEDMFEVLREDGISIRVGFGPTRAAFRLREQSEVAAFVDGLLAVRAGRPF